MKVRIEQSQTTDTDEAPRSLFDRIRGKSPTVTHRTYFFVDLLIERTDEEKAIIDTYSHGETILEEIPLDLTEHIEECNRETDTLRRQVIKDRIELHKRDPIQHELIDFITPNCEHGCRFTFPSIRQASLYTPSQRLCPTSQN